MHLMDRLGLSIKYSLGGVAASNGVPRPKCGAAAGLRCRGVRGRPRFAHHRAKWLNPEVSSAGVDEPSLPPKGTPPEPVRRDPLSPHLSADWFFRHLPPMGPLGASSERLLAEEGLGKE